MKGVWTLLQPCRLYFSASISIGQADKNKLDAQQLLETYLENFSHSLKNDLILRILLTFEEKNLEYDLYAIVVSLCETY